MPQPQLDETTVFETEDLLAALVKRRRRSLKLSLTPTKRDELVTRVMDEFFAVSGAHQDFLARHEIYWRNWRGTPEEITDHEILGEASAKVRVPLTSVHIEQWKSRLIEAMLGGGLIGTFGSLQEGLQGEALQELTDWYRYELFNNTLIDKVLEDITHYVLVDGFALPIPSYEHEERKTLTCREYSLSTDFPLVEQLKAAIYDCFTGEQIESITATSEAGVYNVKLQGIDEPAMVTFLLDGELLIAEVERLEVVFDGVRIHVPNVEDILVPNNHHDLEQLSFFGIRTWLSTSEFERMCEPGRLFESLDDEDKAAILGSAGDKTQSSIPRSISDAIDLEEGHRSNDSVSQGVTTVRWIEVFRWEGTIDLDDEKNVGVAVWVAPQARKCLAIKRLEELNKDGRRSATKFEFIPQPGRFYPVGLAEFLQHVQAEIDGIHNFRLNSGLIATAPFFLYEPAVGMPKDIIRIRPGIGIPCKSPDKVRFPNIGFNAIWGFQEETLTRRNANEQAGLGDAGLGTFVSKRVSASEFSGVAENVELRTRTMIRRFSRSLRELLTRVFGLYQQYAKPGRVFHSTGLQGEEIVKRFKADNLHGKVVVRLAGGPELLDSRTERELATGILQLVLNQFLYNLGIVRPDTIKAAIDRVARAYNARGLRLYDPDVPPVSPPPNVEHQMLLLGQPIAPTEGENFNLHLQAHLQLMQHPQFAAMMPDPMARAALAAHVKATVEMRDQVMALRMQQAAQAQSMALQMERMGIRPGLAGSSTAQAQPAMEAEREGGMEGGFNA